jgi:hypothetical protein
VTLEGVLGAVGTGAACCGSGRGINAVFELLATVTTTAGRSPAERWDSAIGGFGTLVDGAGRVCLIGNEALVKHAKCSSFPPFLVSMHHSATASDGG